MTTRAALAIVGLFSVLCLPGGIAAMSATPVSELRIEWDQVARGRGAVVRGYVYNEHQMRAENVRVRVEQLDADARPLVTRTVYVMGTIPYRDRGYFEVAVPAGGATYRLSIESFDRAGCGNG
jgi:hypothetical protein